MKQQLYFSVFFILFIGLTFNSYGQEVNKQKQGASIELPRQKQEHNYYRKTLQVDSAKAEQVAKVQTSYKSALNLVIADTALNDAAKQAKITALMEIKNQKLRSMLSPAQQEKIIPSTERTASQKEPVNKP